MLVILLLCLGVWMTPHSLVASLEEARKMGGTHHPLLGVFGVMSAKMTVANLMILVTFMSFIMYWRAGKQETATWAKVARSVMGAVLVLAGIAVIVLGVWGYFVPAIIRINYFSTSQVLIVLFVMLTITPLTALLLRSARTTTEMVWGRMPPRAGYALVLNAVMVILLMTLMGYARSSSRVHWHVYGVMRDSSQYAFSPALGYAAAFMALNTSGLPPWETRAKRRRVRPKGNCHTACRPWPAGLRITWTSSREGEGAYTTNPGSL
jgi:uncharacterized membrane protein SirB2